MNFQKGLYNTNQKMRLILLLCCVSIVLAAPLPLVCKYTNTSTSPCANYSPSYLTYTCCDKEGGTVYNWTYANFTSIITNSSVRDVSINLGFNFQYSGNFATSGINTNNIRVCKNGQLMFGGWPCYRHIVDELPSTIFGGSAMAFYSQLAVGTPGVIGLARLGAAPYRYIVIQYEVCSPPCPNPTWYAQFQIKLFETTNHIEFQYKTAYGAGRKVAIGVTSMTGLSALKYYIGYLQPSDQTIPSNSSIILYPPYPIQWAEHQSDSSSAEPSFPVWILFFIVPLVLCVIIILARCSTVDSTYTSDNSL